MQVQCGSCSQLVETPQGWSGQAFPCPRCGVQVSLAGAQPAAAPAGATAAAAPEAAGKRCPFCGEAIQAEALKCRHCGEWLDASKRAGMKGAEELLPKYQKGMKGLGWGLVVLAVLNLGVVSMAQGDMGRGGAAAVQFAVAAFLVLLIAACAVLILVRLVWANYVVLGVFGLITVLAIIGVASGAPGLIVAILIPIIAMINAGSNLSQYRKIKAAGLDPWQPLKKGK
jgi:predicted RNA-binding Zn-ribbon protein involved in translation (DUF1610 family)